MKKSDLISELRQLMAEINPDEPETFTDDEVLAIHNTCGECGAPMVEDEAIDWYIAEADSTMDFFEMLDEAHNGLDSDDLEEAGLWKSSRPRRRVPNV